MNSDTDESLPDLLPNSPPTENDRLDAVLQSLDAATGALREAALNYPLTNRYINSHSALIILFFRNLSRVQTKIFDSIRNNVNGLHLSEIMSQTNGKR